MSNTQYTEDNIRSLDWREHIRLRPGMYIGKLGDGSSADDGIYILLKEILDNSIDEFVMGAGKTIEISIKDQRVVVRDYGRGIPLGKLVDVVSKMNTGGKYDTRAFKKSVGHHDGCVAWLFVSLLFLFLLVVRCSFFPFFFFFFPFFPSVTFVSLRKSAALS